MTEENESTVAPHGRDEAGRPLAPYGHKADGNPKIKAGRPANSERPARAAAPKKPRTSTAKKNSGRSLRQTHEALVGLADMVTMPLVGAAHSPIVAKRLGERQAAALAGDAVIVQSFAPHLADALITLSETKPGVLAFLDTMEEKAPYFMLAQVGVQMTKALISNHMEPDPRLAAAGTTMAQMRTAQLADEIERQAAAMGVAPASVPTFEKAAAA